MTILWWGSGSSGTGGVEAGPAHSSAAADRASAASLAVLQERAAQQASLPALRVTARTNALAPPALPASKQSGTRDRPPITALLWQCQRPGGSRCSAGAQRHDVLLASSCSQAFQAQTWDSINLTRGLQGCCSKNSKVHATGNYASHKLFFFSQVAVFGDCCLRTAGPGRAAAQSRP